MNHYLTEIRAINPREEVKSTTDGLHAYTGPYIKANSLEEAEDFCRNITPYLHVLGLSGNTITPLDLVIDSTKYGDPSPVSKEEMFYHELTNLINRCSLENESNTPDYVLAYYLLDCLKAFNLGTNSRQKYFRREEESPVNIMLPDSESHNMCAIAPPEDDQVILRNGDVVALKTGGILMTVENNCLGESKILCVWFGNDDELRREIFPAFVLEKSEVGIQ